MKPNDATCPTMVYRYAGDDDDGSGWIRKYEWVENPGRWVTRMQAIREAAEHGHIAVFEEPNKTLATQH